MQTFADWLVEHGPLVVRGLLRDFQEFDESRCEDAVQDTIVGLWVEREQLAPLWERGDLGLLMYFLQQRAWRGLRGVWRSCDHARVDLRDDLDEAPCAELMEPAVLSLIAAHQGIERAARAAGPRQGGLLRQALRDHILLGYACGEAASRNGLRREYLCRAKRLLRDDLEGIVHLAA